METELTTAEIRVSEYLRARSGGRGIDQAVITAFNDHELLTADLEELLAALRTARAELAEVASWKYEQQTHENALRDARAEYAELIEVGRFEAQERLDQSRARRTAEAERDALATKLRRTKAAYDELRGWVDRNVQAPPVGLLRRLAGEVYEVPMAVEVQPTPQPTEHHVHTIKGDGGLTECCGKTVFELPSTDRLTIADRSQPSSEAPDLMAALRESVEAAKKSRTHGRSVETEGEPK